jgi:hypothetical protein
MEIIIGWLPFIGSIIVVVLGWVLGRRKQNSEIRKSDTDIVSQMSVAAEHLIAPLNKRIEVLEALVIAQDKELASLRYLPAIVEEQKIELAALRSLPKNMAKLLRGINILIAQLRRLGHEPEWVPEAPSS